MKNQLRHLFLVLTLLISGTVVRSANITWTNAAGGDWNIAQNWDMNQVPGSGDSASIPGGGFNVVISATNSIGGLALGNGAALTIVSNGVLNIEGGMTVEGELTNAGTVNWEGGDISVLGPAGGFTGEIWNQPGALWDIQCDQVLAGSYPGDTFQNAGLVQKDTTTGTTSFNIYLNNTATVEADLGTISLQGGYSDTSSANLAVSLGGTTSGSGYGNINFNTPLAADSTFTVKTRNGFQPNPGDTFAVLSYASSTGIFTNLSSPSGAIWQTNYTANSLILTNVGQINWTAPANITYGAALDASQLNASTTPSLGGTFAYNPVSSTVLNSGAGQLLTTTFTPSIVGDAPASLQVPITVLQAALSITASNLSKTYGQNLTFAGTEFLAGGLVNGDTVTSVSLASGGTISNAPVSGSPYSIVPSAVTGSGLTNYSITFSNGLLTVNLAPLGITANNLTKTYGQNIVFAGTEFVPTGLQNLETVGTVTLTSSGAISNAPVSGSPYSIVPSAATGGTFTPGNYAITYTNGTLTVNPAGLSVTANNALRNYGTANPAFSAIYSGFVNNESAGVISGVPGFSTLATVASPVGGYAITPSLGTLGAANYLFGPFNNGTLTVNAAPLSITASNLSKTYGQNLTFAGTEFFANGLLNSDTATHATLTSSGAISSAPVSGSPYSIVPSAVTGSGLTNYSITYINGLLTVNPAAQMPFQNMSLRMTSSNGVNTVYWTDSLIFGSVILQTSPSLSPTATWSNLATDNPVLSFNSTLLFGGYAALVTNSVGYETALGLRATNSQQFFRLRALNPIPASSFAIYYNGTLEFSDCATMVVSGRVHANGPIDVGTTAELTFNGLVTTTAVLTAPNLDGTTTADWDPANPSTWNTLFNGNPGYITNFPGSSLPYYNGNSHFIIDFPTSTQTGPSYANMLTNYLMLYNLAQMILVVTNTTSGTNVVQLILQSSNVGSVPGADTSPVTLTFTNASPGVLAANLPFLTLTNMTYDQRESKTNFFTQIDVSRLSSWLSTNWMVQGKLPAASQIYPTILYVADNRPLTSTRLPSVRLVNGAQLPTNNGLGFTVATKNPLYVLGNYNIQSGTNGATGTNNAYEVPAALISDALTLLSPSWKDSEGYTTFSFANNADKATTMTVNAAIVTGTIPSTGSGTATFSGGLHNLPRLLENWTAVNLYLNTSIIRLWNSNMATNQWKYQGTYYLPPNRFFNFDNQFLNPAKVPPGIPLFY